MPKDEEVGSGKWIGLWRGVVIRTRLESIAVFPLGFSASSTIINFGPIGESTCYFSSTTPGAIIQKPTVALAGFVVILLLLAVQITVLVLLAV